MSGPPPKDPALRQRQNKASTRAQLPAAGSGKTAPKLPNVMVACPHDAEDCAEWEHPVEWHPLTLAFWESTWASPMAAEYLDADLPGLYRLAMLINQFWERPETKLAGEIRQQQAAYGLTPLDRRRLEWSVERNQSAAKRRMAPAAPAKPAKGRKAKPVEDPRSILRVV